MKKVWFLALLFLLAGLVKWIVFDVTANEAPDNTAHDADTVDHDQRDEELLQRLKTMPYLSHVEDEQHPEKSGVTLYRKSLASKGINLFTSMWGENGFVLDMQGNVLKQWHFPLSVRQQDDPVFHFNPGVSFLTPDRHGDLFRLQSGVLIKTNWDNTSTFWKKEGTYHHELSFDESGNVYTLNRSVRRIKYKQGTLEFEDHSIVILSPQGKLLKQISLFDLVKNWVPDVFFDSIVQYRRGSEAFSKRAKELCLDSLFGILHGNTVEVVDRETPFAKKGDLLVCVRSLNLVMTVDPDQNKIVWIWEDGQKLLDRPHYPTLLDNGNILIFDNGWLRRYSRVIELDPVTGTIVWEYRGRPEHSFYTKRGGMAQGLANNNVLITEDEKGRVFEVTRNGEIVWEFYNFESDRKRTGRRATIYRFLRFSPAEILEINFPQELMGKLKSLGYL